MIDIRIKLNHKGKETGKEEEIGYRVSNQYNKDMIHSKPRENWSGS